MKGLVKRILYHSGVLDYWHRNVHRDTLTVAMFHRVLSAVDPRTRQANPDYTVSLELFERCLIFFKRHYRIVSIHDVLAAANGSGALPRNALLVTFDDGWADTEDAAAPVLATHGVPAVVFVASAAVGSTAMFWEEAVVAAWRTGKLSERQFERLTVCAEMTGGGGDRIREVEISEVIRRLRKKQNARDLVAEILEGLTCAVPPMMSREQLIRLRRSQVSVGGHGSSHAPLTVVASPDEELRESRQALAALERAGCDCVPALSFPHGAHNRVVDRYAHDAGFDMMFTSEPCLNRLVDGRPASRMMGRIEITSQVMSDQKGQWRGDFLALWLFNRPARVCE